MPDGAWIKDGARDLRVYTYQGKCAALGVAGDESITMIFVSRAWRYTGESKRAELALEMQDALSVGPMYVAATEPVLVAWVWRPLKKYKAVGSGRLNFVSKCLNVLGGPTLGHKKVVGSLPAVHGKMRSLLNTLLWTLSSPRRNAANLVSSLFIKRAVCVHEHRPTHTRFTSRGCDSRWFDHTYMVVLAPAVPRNIPSCLVSCGVPWMYSS